MTKNNMGKRYLTKFDLWIENKSNQSGWLGFLFSMSLISILWIIIYFEVEIYTFLRGELIASNAFSNPNLHEWHLIIFSILWGLYFLISFLQLIKDKQV